MEDQIVEPEAVAEDVVVPEAIAEPAIETVVEPVKEEKPKKKSEGYVEVFALKSVSQKGLPDIKPGINRLTKSEADAWLALKSYITLYEGDK